jgi:type IV pilus assembly protein PilN
MVRINLLPVRVSKKKEAGRKELVLFALVILAFLALNYVWVSSRANDLDRREKQVAKTRAEIAQLDKIIGEVKGIQEQQKALQQKLDVLAQLKRGRSGPVRILDELATVTPKRLWLRKLDEKGGRTTMEGTATTIDDVSAFMTALKNSPYFSEVELKKTEAKASASLRLVDFVITAKADYTAVPAPPGGKAESPAPQPKTGGG